MNWYGLDALLSFASITYKAHIHPVCLIPPSPHVAPIEMSTSTPNNQHATSEPHTPPSGPPPALFEATPVTHNQTGSLPHRSSGKPGFMAERDAHVSDMQRRVRTPHCLPSQFFADYLPSGKDSHDTLPTWPDHINKANGKEFVSASIP